MFDLCRQFRPIKITFMVLATSLTVSSYCYSQDLESLRTTYESNLEKIVFENGDSIQNLRQGYSQALSQLLEKVKKNGDLDKTTAVMTEIDRFAKKPVMPKKPSAMKEIAVYQSYYNEQLAKLDLAKSKKILFLASKYDQALERLQRSLVADSKIEQARIVQNERKAVLASEPLSRAQNVVAKQPQPKSTTPIPVVPSPTRRPIKCTLHWSCTDNADVYLNGKALRKYAPSFRERKDEAAQKFSAETKIATGDVITVGCRRGGSYGFLLVAVDEKGKALFSTDTENWKAYVPTDDNNWFPPSTAKRAANIELKVQPNPFRAQREIRNTFDKEALSIWTKTESKFAYFVITVRP